MANSVAEGSLVLTLDASRLNRDMAKQAKKTKEDGKKLGETFRGSATEKIGEVFGGGSLLGMGAKAGIAGLVVAGIATAAKEVYEFEQNMKGYHRELEAGERAIQQWADKTLENFDRVKESLAEFDAIAGTTTGINAYRKGVSQVEADVASLEARLKQAEQAEAGYDSKWNSIGNLELWVRSKFEETGASAKKRTETIRTATEQAKKNLDSLNRSMAKAMNPAANPEARAAMRDFLTEMNDGILNLTRTADEAKLDKLIDKFGFRNAAVAEAKAAIKAKELAEASKGAKDMIKGLAGEVGLFGQVTQQTAEEAALEGLVKKGLGKEEEAALQRLINLKKEQQQQYRQNSALVKGTAEEFSFGLKADFEAKRDADNKAQLEVLKKQLAALNLIAADMKGLRIDAPEF